MIALQISRAILKEDDKVKLPKFFEEENRDLEVRVRSKSSSVACAVSSPAVLLITLCAFPSLRAGHP